MQSPMMNNYFNCFYLLLKSLSIEKLDNVRLMFNHKVNDIFLIKESS